jgi:hypothetical protein
VFCSPALNKGGYALRGEQSQVPPLRFFENTFPEMVRRAAGPSTSLRSGRDDNSFARRGVLPFALDAGGVKLQIPRLPRIPVKVGGVANFMRFSLQKTAHAALSSAANRKSGYARDDKGEGGASMKSSGLDLGEEMTQHTSSWMQAPKGRDLQSSVLMQTLKPLRLDQIGC